MKKLLMVALVAMCFSCSSKKAEDKKQTENVVKKTEAVQEHQCTGDCESHDTAEKAEQHQCTGDCKTCPKEDCKNRKEAYQGAKKAETEAGVEVEKDHDCAGCGSCEH